MIFSGDYIQSQAVNFWPDRRPFRTGDAGAEIRAGYICPVPVGKHAMYFSPEWQPDRGPRLSE